MIIENKPKKSITNYGRISHDLPNSQRLKSFITRNSTININGRQNLAGSRIAYGELFIQVLHNSDITDNAPYVYLVEITDTGIHKYHVGRFSIKQQKVTDRILWSAIDSNISVTLKRYYPNMDSIKALNTKILPYAIELLDTLPDKTSIGQSRLARRKSAREHGILVYIDTPENIPKPVLKQKSKKVDHSESLRLIPTEEILSSVSAKYSLMTVEDNQYQVSGRVHIPTGDTRAGRF